MNKAKRLINTLSARLAAMSLVAAALLATATGLGCLTSRTGGAPRGYSVAVLGDVHYDAPPVERFHSPGRPGHFKCNVLMWEVDMPALLAASGRLVGSDTSFALQLGDLIDGAGDFNSHTQMLTEATAILEKTYPRLPVISVCGNHDIIGGWRRGYNSFMLL